MEAKKIIITGGATRIGSAIAKSLAGYDIDIIIHFNKSKKSAQKLKAELEEMGSKVYLIKADLNNINQVKKIVPFAYKKMKGLDCLINNASLFEKDDLENFSDKSFSKHLDINLKAPALLIKDFKRYVKNKEANIINIIDQRVKKLTPFFFSYTLSKAALATLTTIAAMKLAPNIRVNGISPGPTLKNKRQSDKHFKAQWKATILKKQVDINNICSLIRYYIESDSVTGQIISVDSGQSLAWRTPDILKSKE
ncbi:MAG: SDR family oxidoreductase [Pelagibacteraceae bacterium TMED232]|nr:MAG: SDR family oxidoreductase [Pelagibacteraceae bacterium TMED232]|tara:strand:+ start:579 stop:1334 length:756 start_codon:yes stop_codon:yes gene_type:complete